MKARLAGGATLVFLLGLLSGLITYMSLTLFQLGGGDFGWSLRAARDLLAGRDVYGYPPGPLAIPYPLPAGFVGLLFAWLPAEIAAALFSGASTALLAWLMQTTGQHWRLSMFVSWPFIYGLLFAQWPPLIASMFFTPLALPLLLVKPQIALPLALTRMPSRIGLALTALTLLISLALYPRWPFVWLAQITAYQGTRPPLLVLPLGPLLLLALLRYRSRSAWLLLLCALMPQRMVYDQFIVLLVADSRRALLVLVVCSWLSAVALFTFGGWLAVPGGWQLWVLLASYLPALGVVLLQPLASNKRARAQLFQRG
jgi:hypothetical protein